MVLPPLRLTGAVLTRIVNFRSPTHAETNRTVPSTLPAEQDFESMLRAETRRRAAQLCHYGDQLRPDPQKGARR